MSDTETSQSILDNNGLLITEPDQEVEDELLQSASEDEDKDIQSPTPPNEPANRLTKKSEQKSSRKRPFVRENRVSHSKERPSCQDSPPYAHKHQKDISGGVKCIPPFLIMSVDVFARQGILTECSQLPDCGTLTRKVSLTFILFFFSKM